MNHFECTIKIGLINTLIKKTVNEPFILTVINQSNIVFRDNSYTLINEQSNSESDFRCKKTGYELDATIGFNSSTCHKLSNHSLSFDDYFNVINSNNDDIYEAVVKKLKRNKKKNIILLLPNITTFELTRNTLTSHICTSKLDEIIYLLDDLSRVYSIDIYLLSFDILNKMALFKTYNSNNRFKSPFELIDYPLSKRFISIKDIQF